MTTKSKQAIQNIKQICEEHLKDRCDLEVIDVFRQPVLAKGEQIIATPTLLKKLPFLYGDSSGTCQKQNGFSWGWIYGQRIRLPFHIPDLFGLIGEGYYE